MKAKRGEVEQLLEYGFDPDIVIYLRCRVAGIAPPPHIERPYPDDAEFPHFFHNNPGWISGEWCREDSRCTHFYRAVKIREEYTSEPPSERRKSRRAWRAFTLALGRAPDRMYVNRYGCHAVVKDFRNARLTYELDDFKRGDSETDD